MPTCHLIFQFGYSSTTCLDQESAQEANGRLGGQDFPDVLGTETSVLF
jgi:hypothetical protein